MKIVLNIFILLAICAPFNLLAKQKNNDAVGKRNYNIVDFGAKANPNVVNTLSIQKAIDACAKNNGGVVVVPTGRFITGTIYLKSNVELHLENEAVLLGSSALKDYPVNHSVVFEGLNLSLIYAENATNVAITGKGTIDGNGASPAFEIVDNNPRRPKILFFISCKKVTVKDVTLKNSAFWVQHYLACDGVVVKGITVYSHSNFNNDAIDIDSKNVTVSDCIFNSDDDALCFKSNTAFPCENVTVSNCVLSSNCNAIKMGTASTGGFKNITIRNCVIKLPIEDKFRHWSTKIMGITSSISTISGISLEMVDGGVMDGIRISDITMDGVQTPIFIKLGDRYRSKTDSSSFKGILKNVVIRNIKANSNSLISNSITGIPGYAVENVQLKDIVFNSPGAGTKLDADRLVPENEKEYPENRMFGHSLPASALYMRHARNISLNNVRFEHAKADERPAFVFEDVDQVGLKDVTVTKTSTAAFAKIINSKNISISNASSDKPVNLNTIKDTGFTTVGYDLKVTVHTENTYGWKDLNNNGTRDIYENTSQPIGNRVKDLLSQLTIEEKITMIHGSATFTSGGVLRLGIPPIWMTDGPHGIRLRPEPGKQSVEGAVTYLPTGNTLGATWNTAIGYEYGKVLGIEAKYWGKDILLGPGVNIIRTPLNGRNFEYLSEDPYLVSKMGVSYIKGVQEQGISASVKHFVANNQEVKRNDIDVQMSERALREIYLPAFKAAVLDADVNVVMGAYNKFRGQYCTHNEYLNTILKGEWGFKGIQISDWGAVHNTMEALKYGTDIEMGTPKKYFMGDTVITMIKNGEVPVALIDDKVMRILTLMFKTNRFEQRSHTMVNEKAHQQIALKVAEEGMVLLKNKGNLLPFDPHKIHTVAVIGANAAYEHHGGGGSSRVPAKYEITPLQGIKNLLGNDVVINYVQGYQIKKDGKTDQTKIDEAVKVARDADVVIYVGGWVHGYGTGMEQEKNPAYDAEARDKKDLKLPFGQDELIEAILKANSKTVIVMMGGGAMDMNKWVDAANSIIEAWYPGMEGGRALANIIFGKVNPSGKLPVTFPKKLEDISAHALGEYPGDMATMKLNYKDDIFVGYRYFDTYQIAPQFCFGHGLSYTTFKYSKLNVIPNAENIKVTFTIKNTGAVTGAEVVQLYINQAKSKLIRPAKELKGFHKINLKPGQATTVTLELKKEDLMYYNDIEKQWVFEPGAFNVLIGSSSRDIRLSKKMML